MGGTSPGPSTEIRRLDPHLALLYASLFVVMVGYGSTLAVLPYHAQRVGALQNAEPDEVAFHLGLLTSVYALAQLIVGPAAGRIADRLGTSPVLLGGLFGLAVTQAAFGLTTSLAVLYVLRFAGGVAAAGLLVAATTAVADRTSLDGRTRAMAAYGTSVSLGLVAGPAMAGALSRPDINVGASWVRLDGYSLPFLFSALVTLAVLAYAAPRLRNNRRITSSWSNDGADADAPTGPLRLHVLLGLVATAQYGLAVFEGTFVLYARDRLAWTAGQASGAFVVCGLVMAVLQLPAASLLARVASPLTQVTTGFVLMGGGIAAVLVFETYAGVLSVIAVLAAGTALIIPNLASMVAANGRSGAGLALGWKSSASSLGQFLGPLIGGALIGLRSELPFLAAGGMLLAVAVGLAVIQSRARSGLRHPRRRPLI